MTDSALIFTDDELSELLEEPVEPTPTVDNATLLRIAGHLQTTLLPERVLDLFFQQTRRFVPLDGLVYEHPPLDLSLRVGRRTRHRINYRMMAEGRELGTLTFHRARPFGEEETVRLEHLLGLWNRLAFDETLAREVELARRARRPLSLVVLDVDHFKRINDQYGHDAGDAILRCIAATAQRCCRASDMVFRYGGEEFVLLLGNTEQMGACRLAERLRRQVARSQCLYDGVTLRATVSLGVAAWREGEDGEHLFRRADEALYQAKSAGRNCVRSYSELALDAD